MDDNLPPSTCGLTECKGKPMCARCAHQQRAALASQPAGWRLVPVEPTPEMGGEFDKAHPGADFRHESYRAMLAAAPQPPAQPVATMDREATWWTLVMGAAASVEDAANCLSDPDAKRQAEGAAAHYRNAARKLAEREAAPQPPAQPAAIDNAAKCEHGHQHYCGYCGRIPAAPQPPQPPQAGDDAWRAAVDDMLTVCHEVASDDPRESINRLINWHVSVALDPTVSSDAAALVQAGREQAGDDARDAGRWISVKDQLPEKFVEVLIAFDGLSIASTGQYTASQHDTGGWCYPHENNGACDDGTDPVVTHWMPLPEVPAIAAAKGQA